MATRTQKRLARTGGAGAGGFPSDVFQNFKSDTTRWEPNNALALAWASNLAYENDSVVQQVTTQWGLNVEPTITGPRDIQAFVAGDTRCIILAFRGTVNEKEGRFDPNNWIVNLDAIQVSVDPAFHVEGRIHDGFARAFSTLWSRIQEAIKKLQTQAQSLWITGHSLGGALAFIAAAARTFEDRLPFNGLYTFGQPRVGNPEFCGNCDTHFGDQYFRFVNDEDIVTRVPPRFFPHFPRPDIYGHCGQLRYFDSGGQMHSNENYWNSFLASVHVGFEKLIQLPSLGPINDHRMKEGYIDHIAAYIQAGAPVLS
jgi:triacylglycerol lipase